jgi:hypothetical protein
MPTIAWVLVWVVVIAVVAFFAIREIRSGRQGPADFDRTRHEAVRESESHAGARGPNRTNPMGF